MEKLAGFVVNGGVKMPIGYRFHPTDEELVIHYLKRKVYAAPLPASVIPDFDVFQAHPWALPGDVREKRYFFYNQGNDPTDHKGGTCKRAAGCGYWKPTGRKEKQIVASDETKEVVGMRKTLVYCPRKRRYHHHGTKSRWFMHQFRLLLPCSCHQTNSWVVYCVFQKKRKPQNTSDVGINHRVLNVMVDPLEYISRLQVVLPSVPSSSSCSSDITEVSSSTANDDEEHNSSATINTSYS